MDAKAVPASIEGMSVTEIGNGAFNKCASLVSIDLPDSITSIESHAFGGCAALEEITLPRSLEYIGDEAFKGCSSLRQVNFHSIHGYELLGEHPDETDGIKLGKDCFAGCSSLALKTQAVIRHLERSNELTLAVESDASADKTSSGAPSYGFVKWLYPKAEQYLPAASVAPPDGGVQPTSATTVVPDTPSDNSAQQPSESTPAPAPSKGQRRSRFGCFLLAYANYYNFTGRTTRREYWFFILFFYVVVFALAIVGAIADDTPAYGIIENIAASFILSSALPALTAAIRRVRDAGKKWWCCLIPIYSFVLFCTKSDDKQSEGQTKGTSALHKALGVVLALATIGLITWGVFKTDTSSADALYESEDSGAALYEAGQKYYAGDGVEQDYAKAAQLFKKSADKGNDWGYVDLARCYFNGEGLKQDNDKAVECLQKAAANGSDYAVLWLKSMENDASTAQAAGADNAQEAEGAEGEMKPFPAYMHRHLVDGVVRTNDVSKENIQKLITSKVKSAANTGLDEDAADMFAEVNTYLTEMYDGEYEGDVVISYMNPPSDLSWRAKAHVTARVEPGKDPDLFVWKLVP